MYFIVAVFHLVNFFLIGFAAIYGVLTPFGISGIIGGYNRKKSLLRSFIIQYWLASAILIGISVANIFLAQNFRNDTIRKCQSERFFQNDPTSPRCPDKVASAQNATLIFAIIQGSVLVFLGIFVLVFGIRECKDISIEEEANSLIAKANFEKKDGGISPPSNDHLSPSASLHRNNSNNSNNSNPSNNDDGYIELGRDPNAIGNFVPPRYNQGYVYPTSEKSMPTPYTGIRRHPTSPTRIPSNRIPGSNLSRYPTTVNDVSVNRDPVTITLQSTNGNNNYSQRAYADDGNNNYSQRAYADDGNKNYSQRAYADDGNKNYSQRAYADDGNKNYSQRAYADDGNNNYSQRAYADDVYASASRRPQYTNPGRSLSAKKYNDQINQMPLPYSSQSAPIPTIIPKIPKNGSQSKRNK
ncbi:29363_t:CDS:2, partial [Racocetra persica]